MSSTRRTSMPGIVRDLKKVHRGDGEKKPFLSEINNNNALLCHLDFLYNVLPVNSFPDIMSANSFDAALPNIESIAKILHIFGFGHSNRFRATALQTARIHCLVGPSYVHVEGGGVKQVGEAKLPPFFARFGPNEADFYRKKDEIINCHDIVEKDLSDFIKSKLLSKPPKTMDPLLWKVLSCHSLIQHLISCQKCSAFVLSKNCEDLADQWINSIVDQANDPKYWPITQLNPDGHFSTERAEHSNYYPVTVVARPKAQSKGRVTLGSGSDDEQEKEQEDALEQRTQESDDEQEEEADETENVPQSQENSSRPSELPDVIVEGDFQQSFTEQETRKRANPEEISPKSASKVLKPAETGAPVEDYEIITISDDEEEENHEMNDSSTDSTVSSEKIDGNYLKTEQKWSNYLLAGDYDYQPDPTGNLNDTTPSYESTIPMEFQESMLSVNQFLRYFSSMIRNLENPDLKVFEETVKEKRAESSGSDKKIPIRNMIANMKVNIDLIAKYTESPSKNGQDLQIFVEHFSDFLCLLTSKNPEFQEIHDLFDRTFKESDDNQSKQIPLKILKITIESMFFELGR